MNPENIHHFERLANTVQAKKKKRKTNEMKNIKNFKFYKILYIYVINFFQYIQDVICAFLLAVCMRYRIFTYITCTADDPQQQ